METKLISQALKGCTGKLIFARCIIAQHSKDLIRLGILESMEKQTALGLIEEDRYRANELYYNINEVIIQNKLERDERKREQQKARLALEREAIRASNALCIPIQEYKAWTTRIKSEAVCLDCGKDWDPVALGFDHVPERGPKVFELSKGAKWGWDAVHAEMAKCDIVCHSCHAIRTNARYKAKQAA